MFIALAILMILMLIIDSCVTKKIIRDPLMIVLCASAILVLLWGLMHAIAMIALIPIFAFVMYGLIARWREKEAK